MVLQVELLEHCEDNGKPIGQLEVKHKVEVVRSFCIICCMFYYTFGIVGENYLCCMFIISTTSLSEEVLSSMPLQIPILGKGMHLE